MEQTAILFPKQKAGLRFSYESDALENGVNTMKPTKEEFKLLTNDERLIVIQDLDYRHDAMEILELLSFSDLKNVLEDNAETYPLIHEKYLEYTDNNIREMMQQNKQRIYKKITVKDVIEESCDIVDPMWWTINIYDSYEEYLKSAEAFTLEQRYLFAITWYFAEV